MTPMSWLMTSDLPDKADTVVNIGVPMFMRGSFIAIGTVGSLGNLFVFSILFKHLSKSPGIISID
jgi:hypothetical protein